MKFAVDDLVIEKERLSAKTSYSVDKVVGVLGDSILVTHYGFAFDGEINPESHWAEKPGTRGYRSSIQRFQEHELCTPEEAVIILRELETAQSKLEEEFAAVRSKVQEKLDAAACLVKEASNIIKPLDKEFFDTAQEGRELYLALKDGGWSHSTMSCKYGR